VPATALELTGLVKRYGALTAVDDLSLSLDAGQVLALLGPNGAGKTTTVDVCAGIRRPDGGQVRVLGREPRDRTLRALVGVMPQAAGCYPGARAGEMLALVASYFAAPLEPAALLDRLGLTAAARTSWRRLSGGQQQRLSLAMALVGRPRLVFLDEPTAGLDVQARRQTWELVAELRADGVAVLVTTHALDEAESIADRVVIVDAGRVLADGTPGELTRGGATGTLRFQAPPGLDLAALAAVLPAGTQAREQPAGHYLLTGAVDPQLVAAVTAWCAGQRALATELRVERRSLEELYVELTGQQLRP
jgi:ABC-2 type transport system ATP-binding protein